jgi:membrane-associated protein
MEIIKYVIDLFLHLDKHLALIITQYGTWTYIILFVVVFCETGLIVTPFLPGDSLLFAVGSFSASGAFNVHLIALALFIAAVLGDALNYTCGRYMGLKVFSNPNSKVFKRQHLDRTTKFYEKYGNKTIVLARFVPIVRTFAPFVAGVGKMNYTKFAAYNIFGAALWVGLFVYGGYFFGTIPVVQKNFSLVILMIIGLSVLPIVIEFWKARRGQLNPT